MEFSVSHYTAQDLDAAYHTYDLHPRAEVVLNLDYRQRGLGTESCGPGPLEQYKIKPGRYSWSYSLQAFAVQCSNRTAKDAGALEGFVTSVRQVAPVF
jgi:hypothetical protein